MVILLGVTGRAEPPPPCGGGCDPEGSTSEGIPLLGYTLGGKAFGGSGVEVAGTEGRTSSSSMSSGMNGIGLSSRSIVEGHGTFLSSSASA